ncbi:hypothetical protein G9463_22000 [Haloarcula sp. JP-Z28]|nr:MULTISPECIES: hypothetical protein [Haloarcula]NHN65897.1 hypothetical protein [Haloarcula sp. JP-Z28]
MTRTSESRAVGDERDTTALALAVGSLQRGTDGRAETGGRLVYRLAVD